VPSKSINKKTGKSKGSRIAYLGQRFGMMGSGGESKVSPTEPLVTLKLENEKIDFLIDTGATRSVLNTYKGKLSCPGFGQDRVNFHRTPGRGTAGRADPTWPNRARYSIPCAVMLGSGGGQLGAGTHLWLGSMGGGPVREGDSLGCAVCVVFSPYLYRCCSCSLCLLFC